MRRENNPQEVERTKRALKQLVVLVARAKKRSPLEVIREMEYNLEHRKEMKHATGYSCIIDIAKQKLMELNIGINEKFPILLQLMLAVFNEELSDDLDLSYETRSILEQEIHFMHSYSNSVINEMLGLQYPEREIEIGLRLVQAKSIDNVREVLIVELLYEMLTDKIEGFPIHNRTGM